MRLLKNIFIVLSIVSGMVTIMLIPLGSGVSPKRDLSFFNNLTDIGSFTNEIFIAAFFTIISGICYKIFDLLEKRSAKADNELFIPTDISMLETESEVKFFEFCASRGLTAMKIKETTDKTPDFRINTPSGDVIVEVKQIERTEDDEEFLEECTKVIAIKQRVPQIIHNKKNQLKTYASERVPKIFVFYNYNIILGEFYYLDDFNIAMVFGELGYAFRKNPDTNKIEPLGPRYGRGKVLRDDRATYISAICVLHKEPEPYLKIYHNPFAVDVLHTKYFPDEREKHYYLSNETVGYEEYIGPRE